MSPWLIVAAVWLAMLAGTLAWCWLWARRRERLMAERERAQRSMDLGRAA